MTAEAPPPENPTDPAELDDPSADTLDALDSALDAMRERHPDTTPQWEYAEGVLTALLCTRRAVRSDEWLPMLFEREADAVFASEGERTHFMMHWMARESQLRAALQASIDSLEDDAALRPATLDWRGLLNALPEAERATVEQAHGKPPFLAQTWAAGFLDAVDYWTDDWAPPRDKEIAESMADALGCIAELLEDDRAAPTLNLHVETAPPSVSDARMQAFGEAIWAVYDLFDIARSLGPRIAPARSDKVGRNDPCPCGSGKKFKKCCGA